MLYELFRQFVSASVKRPRFALIASTGLLTCCPLAPPFGYALGPD